MQLLFSHLSQGGNRFYSIELLPLGVQEQVTNLDALRWILPLSALVVSLGSAPITYRRIDARVEMPVEVLLTRAIGLVIV